MMAWLLTGNGEKLSGEMNQLIDDVLLVDDFDLKDLSGFNVETAMRKPNTGMHLFLEHVIPLLSFCQ